jgi:phosphate starvation-inducible protein PhoH and related proteins
MAKKKRQDNVSVEEVQSLAGSPRQPRALKTIVPRNENQGKYFEAIENNAITIGYGPAGTGKTWLGVYQALKHHFNKEAQMKRIIITRPAVEAGEKLGFLPGSLEEKVDPYMRPIYDALYDFIGLDLVKQKIDRGYIEIAPIAFLRGRTFKDCFIIVDEAQNATLEQLKMVVTRLGENSKMVINGDPGQTDLPKGKDLGLRKLVEIVRGVENVAVVPFGREDIVRSQIVVDLVTAFETYEEAHPNGNGNGNGNHKS